MRKRAIRLVILFASLYLLTMGGHTSTSDEENIYYVARSLVERAALDVPYGPDSTVLSVEPGTGGRLYSPTGLVPSFMELPFLELGRGVAELLPPRYSDYLERLFVGLMDPLLTALTCGLVFLLAVELGFSIGLSTLLGLAFGLSTIAWPYSKYAWSEPVTAFWLLIATYAAVRGTCHRRGGWLVLSGLALGLSLGSKISTSVVVPGFALYMFMQNQQPPVARPGGLAARLRQGLSRCGLVALGLAPMLIAIGLADYVRFGDPLLTGYQAASTDAAAYFRLFNPDGMLGLLVSPGKSLFLYSPLLLLGLISFPIFGRRVPAEATLFGFIILAHVTLYGSFIHWHGDASWGPRYLVPITAFLLLPAGALLSAGARLQPVLLSVFGVLFALGLVVQLSGVLVNYASYTSSTGGNFSQEADHRRWDPQLSPLVGHWRVLVGRVRALLAPEVSLEAGFYQSESRSGGILPRWTNGLAELFVQRYRPGDLRLSMKYEDYRPPGVPPAEVDVWVDDQLVPSTASNHEQGGPRTVETLIRTGSDGQPLVLTLRSSAWNPSAAGLNDPRELGVFVTDLAVRDNERVLSVGDPFVPPFPISDARPWSRDAFEWFYRPGGHLLDLWFWYLWFSGLPHWLLLSVGPLITELLLSVAALRRVSLAGASSRRIGRAAIDQA